MKKFLKKIKSEVLPTVLPSATTGLLVGFTVFIFKVTAEFAVKFSKVFYTFALKGVWQGAICLSAVIALSLLSFLIAKKFPFSKGGGIPFAFAISKIKLKFAVLGTFFATFLSAIITFFVGVPLGTEGPSVCLGALCGYKLSKDGGENELTIAAAGSGFCAATGSAIGGFLFSIEEMRGSFKAKQITTSFFCVIFTYISSSFLCRIFGVHFFLFEKQNAVDFPISMWFLPLISGILCGVAAILFTKFAVKTRKFLRKLKTIKVLLIPFVFIAVFFTAVFLKDATASGHNLVETLFKENSLLKTMILLFVLRGFFLILSNSAGVTGGTFLPLLALGALMGGICLLAIKPMGALPLGSEIYFILLFMAAFVGAVNKMPFIITAFLCETVCGFKAILPILIASLISFFIFKIFCKKDLTEEIFEELSESE